MPLGRMCVCGLRTCMRGLRRPHCRRSGGADLDYDGFPLRNMDSIFDECGDSPFCAVADTMTPINPKYRGQYFNGGVLVLRPNATTYAHLLREAEADASAERARWYAEQGFLNTHFRASAKRLPGGYNVMGASLDRGLPQKRWKRVRLERDFFVHRAYVAMGQSSVRGGGAGEEGVGSGRADRPLRGAGGRVGAAGRRQNAFALLCFALL